MKKVNYIMLTIFDDDTYNVDFFNTKEKAEGWKEFELNKIKNGIADRNYEITIYEPVREENKN